VVIKLLGKTYPKIETVFDRDEHFHVVPGKLRRPEFNLVRDWLLTEKVDGTNVRLTFVLSPSELSYGLFFPTYVVAGKTDNASLHPTLLTELHRLCEEVRRDVRDTMLAHKLTRYVLHGEGFGPKIQNGGRYGHTPSFALFDVQVHSSDEHGNEGGGAFLPEHLVTATADQLGLLRVPLLGMGTIDDALWLVRRGVVSDVAEPRDPNFLAEGVVAKTAYPLYTNRGDRLIWKLKSKDVAPEDREYHRSRVVHEGTQS